MRRFDEERRSRSANRPPRLCSFEGRSMHRDDHDLGLAHDLDTLARMTERRRVLGWLLGALAPALGCGADNAMTSGTTSTGGTGGSGATGSTTGGGSTTTGPGTATRRAPCSNVPEE